MDEKHGHSDCGYGPLLASYIFDEATSDERLSLEAHFESCVSCAEEAGALGGIRREVVGWKASEFDALAMPVVDLGTIVDRNPRAVASSEASGILGAVAAFFSQWRALALAGGSFAALALLVAGVYVASSRNAGDGLAAKQLPSPTQTAASNNRPQTAAAATPPVANVSPKPVDSEPRAQVPATTAAGPKAEKTDAKKPATRPNTVRVAAEAGRRKPAAKPASDGLNPLGEEEEDDGLRLADLFDEIGMK